MKLKLYWPVSLVILVLSLLLVGRLFYPDHVSEAAEAVELIPAAVGSLPSPTIATTEATLSLTSSQTALKEGVPFAVTLMVDALPAPLTGFQFDVHYDAALMRLDGVDTGRFWAGNGRFLNCPNPRHLATGLVRYTCISIGDEPAPQQAGPLAVFNFTPLSVGRGDVVVTAAHLVDSGQPVQALTTNLPTTTLWIQPDAIFMPLFKTAPTAFPAETTAVDKGVITAFTSGSGLTSLAMVGVLMVQSVAVLLMGAFLWLVVRFYRQRRYQHIISLVVVVSMLGQTVTPFFHTTTAHAAPPAAEELAAATTMTSPTLWPDNRGESYVVASKGNCYKHDLDCDGDVDELDVGLAMAALDCHDSQRCYARTYDIDGNNDVDLMDMAAVANDYDMTGPVITITAPLPNEVSVNPVQVTGIVSDSHAVLTVTVNGVNATLTGNSFAATVPISDSYQVIDITAVDEVGMTSFASQFVQVDSQGPTIYFNEPYDGQAVYTISPTLSISYTDYYTGVDTATFTAVLTHPNGLTSDITSNFTVGNQGAVGTLATSLSEDATYSVTTSIADANGFVGRSQITFYIPANAETIVPPPSEGAIGWVSGYIYDSESCTSFLTNCQGLAGAEVRLEAVNEPALVQARYRRAQQLANNKSPFAPLPSMVPVSVTQPLSGTVLTGPDGFFAFPVLDTDTYWLRVEKSGFTYGQREAIVVPGQDIATNDIYLTPIDSNVMTCDDTGCNYASGDGQMKIDIPPGAIWSGDQVSVSATQFDRVFFLPSGDLPPGTWETYAFNLGGESDYEFQIPVTISIRNDRGFQPGTQIPLGYWNQNLMQWEQEGVATVDTTGDWVVMQVMHFSNHDPNFPVPEPDIDPRFKDLGDEDIDCCEGEEGSYTNLRSGNLRQGIGLPAVDVLGRAYAPEFTYSTDRAASSDVIDVGLTVVVTGGAQVGSTIDWELYIGGEKTDSFTLEANLDGSGELGRFRYFWDGLDAQGNRHPAGVYQYAAKAEIPYVTEYCGPNGLIFGGPPDCTNFPTGVYVTATKTAWTYGTVTLLGDPDNGLGMGWSLYGMEQLYENSAGRILIDRGEQNTSEYYFPGKDMVQQAQIQQAYQTMRYALSEAPPAAERQAPRLLEARGGNFPYTVRTGRAVSGTVVSGVILSDTTWSVAGSPYTLATDVTVDSQAILTIEPGVSVQMPAYGSLYVDGRLMAVGTITAPITFTGNQTTPWGMVQLGSSFSFSPTTSAPSQLSHITFDGGGYMGMGVMAVYSTQAKMNHITLQNSQGMGIYADSVVDLSVAFSNFLITGTNYAIFNATPATVITATYNYWGADDGPYHLNDNPTGSGAWVSDGVLFQPWLEEAGTGVTVLNETGHDFSRLEYDLETQTYRRVYEGGTVTQFDEEGRHAYTQDPDGTRTVYTYDTDGKVTTMGIVPVGSSSAAWTWTFSYNNDHLSHITGPSGRVTQFDINNQGDLVGVTYPDNSGRSFVYNADHLMTQTSDQRQEVTGYAYDGYGRINQLTSPQRSIYDQSSGTQTVQQPVRSLTPSDTSYPLLNDSITGDPINPAPAVPTSTLLIDEVSYGRGGYTGHTNSFGLWVDVTDSLGRTTAYERDDSGYATQITWPDGDCERFTYDNRGNELTSLRLPASKCTTSVQASEIFTDFGGITGTLGLTVVLTGAEEFSNTTGVNQTVHLSVTAGYTRTYESRFNQVKTVIDPLGRTTTYHYDYELGLGNAGNLVRVDYPQVMNGQGVTVTPSAIITYNSLGLIEAERDLRGTVTRYVYTQGTADEASGGAKARFAAGVAPVPGLLTEVIEDDGGANLTTTYTAFDMAGNATVVIEPGHTNTITLAYDNMNRVISDTNALGITNIYEYDAASNLIREVWDYTEDGFTGRNVIIEYSYDVGNRLLSKRTLADGLVTEAKYTYDINGQVATEENGLGQRRTYIYDDADQLINEIDPAEHIITYTYTLDGRRERMIDVDGYTTRYVYDSLGRMGAEDCG